MFGLAQSTDLAAIASSDAWGLVGVLFIGLIGFMIFSMTPLSNILNVVTVPLGYEWQSCPNCPSFGIEKITYTDCANCGETVAENFSRSTSPAGESTWYYFCDSDCHDEWGGENQ